MDEELENTQNQKHLKEGQDPMDFLRPESEQHTRVLNFLIQRLEASERKMSDMYARWRVNELKMQAYINLSDYDETLKKLNEGGKAPSPVSITVPFTFSTIQTIVTYLFNTFGGRNPIFSVGSTNSDQANKVAAAEMLLQYNADFTRFLKHLYQFLLDDSVYGLAVMRMLWISETREVEKLEPPTEMQAHVFQQMGMMAEPQRVTKNEVVFEGSDVATIDPYMFFPDPRVPMTELNRKGEFVFWRAFEAPHALKQQEALGTLRYVKDAKKELPVATGRNDTARDLRIGTSLNTNREGQLQNYYQVDQGTCYITPAELGLGTSKVPELWLFTILNKSQIVQASPVSYLHRRLPVEVCESSSMGYTFGSLSTADYLAPLQDTMSWLINSHIYNVRSVMNNQFVVDPNKVVLEDLMNPEPGKLIRLRNVPFGGMDVRQAVQQLPVQDVTRSHIADFEQFARFGAEITGASENLRGINSSGGRKTATEVRVSGEAGSSRLAAKAKLISAQALTGVAEQMLCNYQQFMTQEHEFRTLGPSGNTSLRVTPDLINSTNYNFPIHDGTLPMDKIAMVDLWREILQTIMMEPTGEFRQRYDVGRIFEWIAKLGGAQNIDSFKIQTAAPEEIDKQVQQGNMISLTTAGENV